MKNRTAFTSLARYILVLSVLLLGVRWSALAQAGRGGISGLVSDQSGAIVSGARVTAQDQANGVKVSTISTGAGLYTFVSLCARELPIDGRREGI